MTDAPVPTLVPEGFRPLDVSDDFVGLIGPLWYKVEGEKLRIGLPLEKRHGNPMGWAHGGLLVTVADMVMGAGSGYATGIRWPHPTVSLGTEFVRGARLGQWLEGTARIARRTLNFCFASCDLVCGGEIVLVASGVFKVPDVDKIPEEQRARVMGKWGET
ncbi:MAG: PaaI family thioesterase [Alphaproteobacteria bacterium]|jgi:acyl-coenzyme A thioesterase PaaI-like protein